MEGYVGWRGGGLVGVGLYNQLLGLRESLNVIRQMKFDVT